MNKKKMMKEPKEVRTNKGWDMNSSEEADLDEENEKTKEKEEKGLKNVKEGKEKEEEDEVNNKKKMKEPMEVRTNKVGI